MQAGEVLNGARVVTDQARSSSRRRGRYSEVLGVGPHEREESVCAGGVGVSDVTLAGIRPARCLQLNESLVVSSKMGKARRGVWGGCWALESARSGAVTKGGVCRPMRFGPRHPAAERLKTVMSSGAKNRRQFDERD
jgi:hypothetical protein